MNENNKTINGIKYYKYVEEGPSNLWNGMPDDQNVWSPEGDGENIETPEFPFVCDCGNTTFKLWFSGSYELAGTCAACGKSSQVYAG